jgi:hypothetical protein
MLAHPPGARKHRHCPRNAVGRSTCRVNRHGEGNSALAVRPLRVLLAGEGRGAKAAPAAAGCCRGAAARACARLARGA